jgi:hypothetical protein
MFGRGKRRRNQPEPGEPRSAGAAAKQDRIGSAMFYVLGPATVEGALQGHSPEARRAWKDLVENNKRARREARREPEPDDHGSRTDW